MSKTFRALVLPMVAAAMLVGCGKPMSGVAPQVTTAVAAPEDQAEALRAYPVEKMLGIGPAYGAKLREAGIDHSAEFLEATKTRYARQKLAEKTGIPYKTLMGLAQKAALMRISGVGPRQSNLLAAVGVDSVAELAQRRPESLQDRLALANTFKPKFVDHLPSVATVGKWIEAAKKLNEDLSKE